MCSASAKVRIRLATLCLLMIITQASHCCSYTSAAYQHHPPLMQVNRRAVRVLLVADPTVLVAVYFSVVTPA